MGPVIVGFYFPLLGGLRLSTPFHFSICVSIFAYFWCFPYLLPYFNLLWQVQCWSVIVNKYSFYCQIYLWWVFGETRLIFSIFFCDYVFTMVCKRIFFAVVLYPHFPDVVTNLHLSVCAYYRNSFVFLWYHFFALVNATVLESLYIFYIWTQPLSYDIFPCICEVSSMFQFLGDFYQGQLWVIWFHYIDIVLF